MLAQVTNLYVIFVLILSIALHCEAQQCYWPDGTAQSDSEYAPCSNDTSDPLSKICCASWDTCLPNGLCKPNDFSGGVYWRETCTESDWSQGNCQKLCSEEATQRSDNSMVVPCDGRDSSTTWCCGDTTDCCNEDSNLPKYVIAKVLGDPIPTESSSAALSDSSAPSSTQGPSSTAEPSSTSSSTPTTSPPPSSSGGLSSGAKAGIGVGATVGAIVLIALGVFIAKASSWRKKATWMKTSNLGSVSPDGGRTPHQDYKPPNVQGHSYDPGYSYDPGHSYELAQGPGPRQSLQELPVHNAR